jgi:hypothetical protein
MLKGMKKFNYKLKSGIEHIVPLGDMHYGAKNCDVKEFKKTIKKIADLDAKVILMGDLIDNASKTSVGAGVYEQDYNPTEQISNLVELLQPIKKNILFSVIGNHEARELSEGIDLSKIIADSIGCDYAQYVGVGRLFNKNISYDIFAWHGATGAATVPGKLRPIMQKSEWFDADIYLQGHVHELYHVTEIKRFYDGDDLKDKLKHFVLTGSYLKYDGSYAEQKGLKPCKMGSPLIRLNGKKHEIGVDLEW